MRTNSNIEARNPKRLEFKILKFDIVSNFEIRIWDLR